MNRVLPFSLLVALVSIPAVLAEQPKVAFDATYETTTPSGVITTHMLSDGKGHMRTETKVGGQVTAISLMDYPAKQATSLIVAQKMAFKSALKDAEGVHDAESAKRMKAKDLGAKNIDGHNCHGYEYSNASGTNQVWIGDDIHYIVHSESMPKGGPKVVMSLKNWSSKAPSPDVFNIPAGYKEMKM